MYHDVEGGHSVPLSKLRLISPYEWLWRGSSEREDHQQEKTVLDNRLTPTFFELSLTRWLRQHSLSLEETLRFESTLPSPHRSTTLSACPPTNIRFRFFDSSACVCKVFLSHSILTCMTVCTSKKRVLFGAHDVPCDFAHSVTSLSLSVVVFVMMGSMWHSTSPFPHHTRGFSNKRHTVTRRVSCRSPSSFETPFVIGLGEGYSEVPYTPILLQVCKSLHKV